MEWVAVAWTNGGSLFRASVQIIILKFMSISIRFDRSQQDWINLNCYNYMIDRKFAIYVPGQVVIHLITQGD